MESATRQNDAFREDFPSGSPAPGRASIGQRLRALFATPGAGIALRIAALVILLALLLRLIDGRATMAAIANADLRLALIGVALVQVQVALSALRWKFTAGRLALHLPFWRAIREYYVATFLNQVLPGGVAGDAVRAYRNRVRDDAGERRWREALRSVALERGAGQVAFFAVSLAGLAAWPLLLPASAPDEVEALVAVPIVIFVALAALLAFAATRGPLLLRSALAGIGPDLRRVFLERFAWLYQGGLSLVVVTSYVAVFVVAGAALGVAIPVIAWFTIVPMVLLAMLIPVSIGGWGLREGAASALFPIVGIDASLALAIAIVYGLINLAGSLPGLALFLATRRAG
jgi:glycosyltransferase 2 family protein